MDIRVRDLMHRPAISVPITANVADVVHKMVAFHVRHVVVVDDDGRAWGVVSDRDLRSRGVALTGRARSAEALRAAHVTPVGEVASAPAVTASADDHATDAAKRMVDLGIGSLVVVDARHGVVGILTRGDFVRVFASGMVDGLERREDLWRRSLEL